ncbi:MAG: carbohydrate-binding family 9-like protein [Bacteroidota bacterium]
MIVVKRTDQGGRYLLEHANWVPSGSVRVHFDILHDGSSIFLKYFVREPQVRAVNSAFNSPVWEDSCVEFFISLDGEDIYYNFEFNAIGTVLGGAGRDRNSRDWLPVEVLEKIETKPSLGRDVIESLEEETSWTLEVRLPVSVLCHSKIDDLSGVKATANFYKCGDKLKQPHFISWKPVLTEKPDFHRPEYFGELVFE